MPPLDSGVGDHTRSGQQRQGEAQLAARAQDMGAAAIAVRPPTTICEEAKEGERLGLVYT